MEDLGGDSLKRTAIAAPFVWTKAMTRVKSANIKEKIGRVFPGPIHLFSREVRSTALTESKIRRRTS